MPHTFDPSVPTWVCWTNRALVTLNGTVGAVMVANYASTSGQALDVALVAAVVAATVVAVLRPDRVVPVTSASLLAMLGLALIPPAWLLALLPPLLLTWVRRRQRGWLPHRRPAPPRDHDEDVP